MAPSCIRRTIFAISGKGDNHHILHVSLIPSRLQGQIPGYDHRVRSPRTVTVALSTGD